MRKILFILSLWLAAIAAGTVSAENLILKDGATLSGEIVHADDNGLMLRLPGDVFKATNLAWLQFSPATLKELADNPKTQIYATPFLAPTNAPEIKVNPVTRLAQPEHLSLFSGLAGSSVGLFILLVLYAANLYAGYEVAVMRDRPIALVVGLSAVLPVIGPIVFLALPAEMDSPEDETDDENNPVKEPNLPEEIHISESSWKQAEKPHADPQIFTRGKYTFNKRFIETRFAAFTGEAAARTEGVFTMEVATAQERLIVLNILQISPEEAVFHTLQRGQVIMPLADIQEIKLIPKNA